jgi:glycosyltransferase involved in cell wall biosynthesis
LARGLTARGHEVHVYTTNVDGPHDTDVPLGEEVDVDGVRVRYFGCPVLRRLNYAPALGRELAARVAGFDLVHLHSLFLWPPLAGARAAWRRGIPYVLSPRGMLVRDLVRRKSRWLKTAWIALHDRRNIRRAAALHVTSRREADQATRFGGLTLPPLFVVPNGVDANGTSDASAAALPETLRVEPGQPLLLFLGRVSWVKGLDRLIRALQHVPLAHLAVAGNDEEGFTPGLKQLARETGVSERISFVGMVSGATKEALLRRSDLLVLPSYSENFGNVVLEALRAGRPAVVTPEVGAADVIHESGAGRVLDGAPETLGRGLAELLADRDALRRMGRTGREVFERRYTWDAVAAQMEEQYGRIVAAASSGGVG